MSKATKAVQKKEKVVVISVGGSLVVPEEIDTDFLSSFKELVLKRIKKGEKFVIITGGGKVCRKYQNAAAKVGSKNSADADWIGIDATRINARLMRSIFGNLAEDHIIQSPLEKFSFTRSIIVGGGWKPGFSSDFDAVLLAKRFKASKLINLSNIDYIYTADPKTNPEATRIEQISWKEFRKIIPKKWAPGLSSPFDPVASKEAESIGLQVAIINGKKLEELENFLNDSTFVGSLIK